MIKKIICLMFIIVFGSDCKVIAEKPKLADLIKEKRNKEKLQPADIPAVGTNETQPQPLSNEQLKIAQEIALQEELRERFAEMVEENVGAFKDDHRPASESEQNRDLSCEEKLQKMQSAAQEDKFEAVINQLAGEEQRPTPAHVDEALASIGAPESENKYKIAWLCGGGGVAVVACCYILWALREKIWPKNTVPFNREPQETVPQDDENKQEENTVFN